MPKLIAPTVATIEQQPVAETTGIQPYWTSPCGKHRVYVEDCREVLRQLEDKFDSVCTDPPYGLEFMGKEWDAPWKNDGSVDAREKRADEMTDENKRRYIAAAAVTYGRSKRNNGKIDQSTQSEDTTGRGTWVFGGTPSSERRVVYGTSDMHALQEWFHSCFTRVIDAMKPGAHLCAFSGTRTYHRLGCAIEDAGFDVRDMCSWVYSSGFPKSMDISKAIDRSMGLEREVVAVRTDGKHSNSGTGIYQMNDGEDESMQQVFNETSPASPEAEAWVGWGTALKPAQEPICLARKPLIGTMVENVLEHGVGGLNIDGCRVGNTGGTRGTTFDGGPAGVALPCSATGVFNGNKHAEQLDKGRWPANLLHDNSEEVTSLFPSSSSSSSIQSKLPLRPGDSCPGQDKGTKDCPPTLRGYDDDGSCARYFASFPLIEGDRIFYTSKPNSNERGSFNVHPTVKPVALMAYLIRLVTPPNGLVLDPFMGSGTTGVAAIREGHRFVGIEQSKEYADIAIARLLYESLDKTKASEDFEPEVVQ